MSALGVAALRMSLLRWAEESQDAARYHETGGSLSIMARYDAEADTLRRAADALAAATARIARLEEALRGIFARLDHPDNRVQRVEFFLRWPEVRDARAALGSDANKGEHREF